MTLRREWFSEFKASNSNRYVYIANNDKLSVKGYGKIYINTFINDKWVPRILMNVQYVPELKQKKFIFNWFNNQKMILYDD